MASGGPLTGFRWASGWLQVGVRLASGWLQVGLRRAAGGASMPGTGLRLSHPGLGDSRRLAAGSLRAATHLPLHLFPATVNHESLAPGSP